MVEFEKEFMLRHPHVLACQERYFIWRYMREEMGIKVHNKIWPGVSFHKTYQNLRRRTSPLLENKYQSFKEKWDNDLGEKTKTA